MYNSIRLVKGTAFLTNKEYKAFQKGDTIYGNDSNPVEITRWISENKEYAKEELTKHKCSYIEGNGNVDITEYALEYCNLDDDGEFIEGSDYVLAEEK